tara:strand:- start:2839 stop:3006 length:168 start_codon:yes stop_codon:yes gene_type:complete
MVITTEQEAINEFFPGDNTKTIDDVIQTLVDGNLGTIEEVKEILKTHNPSVDWSF